VPLNELLRQIINRKDDRNGCFYDLKKKIGLFKRVQNTQFMTANAPPGRWLGRGIAPAAAFPSHQSPRPDSRHDGEHLLVDFGWLPRLCRMRCIGAVLNQVDNSSWDGRRNIEGCEGF
jgi:hypothetical protein